MRSLAISLLFLSAFTSTASATFNLNTSGPDWSYTAKDLASTTSQACKDAYSADIDCDYTLVGLVASMRTVFDPQPSDFENTCTSTCKDSLDAYVQNVKAACSAPGDKAQEEAGGGSTDQYLDPVELVGQIFQYTYAYECSKLSNGTYCYFPSYSQYAPNADTFTCDDTCSVDFYQVAHDFPASAYTFNYYWLISRGPWWAEEFAKGWTRLQKLGCAKAVDNAPSSSSSAEDSTVSSVAMTSAMLTTTAIAKVTSAQSESSVTTGASSATSVSRTASIPSGTAASTSLSSSSLSSTSSPQSSSTPIATANSGHSLSAGKYLGGAFLGLVSNYLFI